MTDSDPRAQRLVKPSIDRVGLTDCKWNGGVYDCRVDIRVHSPGREDSASIMGNRTDSHTVSPDITMEAQVEFHRMYEYICLIEPLGATENKTYQDHGVIRELNSTTPNLICECTRSIKEFHNQGFIQGVHGPVHTDADRTGDIKPCGISHLIRDEGSPELANGTEHVIKPDNKHSKAGYGIPSESKENNDYMN